MGPIPLHTCIVKMIGPNKVGFSKVKPLVLHLREDLKWLLALVRHHTHKEMVWYKVSKIGHQQRKPLRKI